MKRVFTFFLARRLSLGRAAAVLAVFAAQGACANSASEPVIGVSAPREPAPLPPLTAPPDACEGEPPLPAPGHDAGDAESDAGTALRPLLADEAPSRYTALGVTSRPVPGHHGYGGRPYHPAPRIVIDVANADAVVAAALQRTARNLAYWPVRHCYESGLRRDQRVRGKITIDLGIAANGLVSRAVVTASTLADPVVSSCAARELALLSFEGANAETSSVAELTLSPGDDPVFLPAGTLDARKVRQALQESWPAAEQCYVRALEADPAAGGRMELHFRVTPEGDVTAVEEGDPHWPATEMAECVVGVYRALKLPPHVSKADSGERTFVYALEFESTPLRSP